LYKFSYLRNDLSFFKDTAEWLSYSNKVLDVGCGEQLIKPFISCGYLGFDRDPILSCPQIDLRDKDKVSQLGSFDTLLFSGMVWDMKKSHLNWYISHFKPKLVIFTHTTKGVKRLEAITEDFKDKLIYLTIKTYSFTTEPRNGTSATELNERVTQIFYFGDIDTEEYYNYAWKKWNLTKPRRFETGLYKARAEMFKDFIEKLDVTSILEVASGGTVLARTIVNNLNIEYEWTEFVDEAIKTGSKEIGNLPIKVSKLDMNDLRHFKQDTIICVSIEHIKDDISFLRQLPKGKRVLLSLNNIKSKDHFRFFKNKSQVRKYYKEFNITKIEEGSYKKNNNGFLFKFFFTELWT
jgi:2-polyprenyl-3-methyl-5-hydroxy-6-metoxy-1,4-benzoquinol methylase